MRVYALFDLRNRSFGEESGVPVIWQQGRPLSVIYSSPASAAAAAVSAQPKEVLAILLVPNPQKNMAGLARFRVEKGKKTWVEVVPYGDDGAIAHMMRRTSSAISGANPLVKPVAWSTEGQHNTGP